MFASKFSMSKDGILKKTALLEKQCILGAKLVDFHGWQLPLHYGSQLTEHMATRQAAGLFDVSHMTIIDVLGAGGRQFLRQLLANDVDKLKIQGQALYSLMLNEQGGIIDDLIVYYRTPDNYRLILNSATFEKDLAWLNHHADGRSLGIQVRDELGILAIQGPEAISKTLTLLPPDLMDAASTLAPFNAVDKDDWFIARTGYTGESGFEMISSAEHLSRLWDQCIEAGIVPCGLGARDLLRIEAGLLLYGQDMDETVNPYESGLGWTVSFKDENRHFIGCASLAAHRDLERDEQRHFFGVVLEEKAMLRAGQPLLMNDKVIGCLTSATFSPILGRSIAFARIKGDIAAQPCVQIRNKQFPVKLVKPCFVKQGQKVVEEVVV